MKCFCCKSETVDTTTKFIADLGQCVVIVKNVPARVCPQCGETSYSNEVAQQLEKIMNAVKRGVLSEVAIVEYSSAGAA